MDPSDPKAFRNGNRIGHRIDDTMWPWNGDSNLPRPQFAPPRKALVASPITPLPGPKPTVGSMIDYQGVIGGGHLGFDYDDVPFDI
jgi:tyrosinase